MSILPNRTLLSWRDQGLNEVLWAVIIRGNMDQRSCLNLFRKMVVNAHEKLPDREETFITHSALSILSNDHFDILFQPIFENEEAKNLLRALLLFKCLPDKHHWDRNLKIPEAEPHSTYLFKGVSSCLDHQSQESTDIRWLKVAYKMIVCEQIIFPEDMQEEVEEIRLYPDYGDQNKVRPSIRAMEMSFRGIPPGKSVPDENPDAIKNKIPEPWHDAFWKEALISTPCIMGEPKFVTDENSDHYKTQFLDAYKAIVEHFNSTLETTDINPRHDTAFGILLYSIILGVGACGRIINCQVEGRIILRTIVESYITLKYLAKKDEPELWEQFRNYGTGQSKLALLKNLKEENLPSFINLEDLQNYANEDIWLEYMDINLKSWAEKNLRKLAEEANIKSFYDQYYDWTSGYVHGHWGAIRDTVYTVCLNPLHRYHRVPFIPRFDMPSVLPDIVKIINLLIETLNSLYPSIEVKVDLAESSPQ